VKAILTRQYNGLYSLLRYEPIMEKVAGTDHTDAYVKPGDPIGFRNMCEVSVAAILSLPSAPLTNVGETMKIEIFALRADSVTPELRRMILKAQQL